MKKKTYRWITACWMIAMATAGATDMTDDQISKALYKELVKQMTPLEGTTPAQWRVVWSGDASTTATVSWSTALHGKKHILHYGTEPFGTNVKKYPHHLECQKTGAYSISAKEAKDTKTAFYHHAELKELAPNTNYYFVMESDGELSRQLYFKTSPRKGDFKLLVGGDSRTGTVARCRMNLRLAKEFKQKPEIIGLNHGGDFVSTGSSWRQWRVWLSNHELTTLSDGRVLPVIPTKGNHDHGILIFEVFNWEKKGTTKLKNNRLRHAFWHTTRLSDDVHIVTLDTNYSAKGLQEDWLDKELKELRPKTRWLLTNYHRPMYPAVKGPAQQFKVFVPLFEKYDVDLALESDGHCIKRTVPIRNDKKDASGVVYIGEGGLGVGQYHPKSDRWYLQGGYVSRGHHVMELSFSEKELKVESILLNGKVVDSYRMKPRK